jgi:hypothetical protein
MDNERTYEIFKDGVVEYTGDAGVDAMITLFNAFGMNQPATITVKKEGNSLWSNLMYQEYKELCLRFGKHALQSPPDHTGGF